MAAMAARLWPDGKGGTTFRPDLQGKYLLSELDALTMGKLRLPGTNQGFRPCIVRRDPDPFNPESRARIEFWLPDGFQSGPKVHVAMLAWQGRISDPAHDLFVNLCHVWDAAKRRNRGLDGKGIAVYAERPCYKRDSEDYVLDKDGNRILIRNRRGYPVPTKNHKHKDAVSLGGWERNPAADCVELLSPERQLAMAYPVAFDPLGHKPKPISKQVRSNRLSRIRDLLTQELEAHGFVKCEWAGRAVRVLQRHPLDPVYKAGWQPKLYLR